jgi:hypothetical protein
MGDSVDSVKALARSYRRWAADAEKAGESASKQARLDFAIAIETVVTELEDLRKKIAPLPTRLGDLSDIPPELRAELAGVEVDELEGNLVTIINSYGGTADLNQVLVGLFRKFNIVQTRRFVQQKLWRMTTDGLIWGVPKRKGVYTTTKPPTPESSPKITTVINDDDFGDFGSPGPTKRPAVARKPNDDDEIPF